MREVIIKLFGFDRQANELDFSRKLLRLESQQSDFSVQLNDLSVKFDKTMAENNAQLEEIRKQTTETNELIQNMVRKWSDN